ncbi:MAG: hypothetical protein QXD57_07070, partial [Ignisphaera sp.]
MTRQQTHPLPSGTRAVYPHLPITRQTLIEPKHFIVKRSKVWTCYSGESEQVGICTFDGIEEFTEVYLFIYLEASAYVKIIATQIKEYTFEPGTHTLSVTAYRSIHIFIYKSINSIAYVYACEVIVVGGRRELIRIKPTSISNIITIHGNNIVADCKQSVVIDIVSLDGNPDFYVNGEYVSNTYLYKSFPLDSEVVVSTEGYGMLFIEIYIYPGEIVLGVDTAYIVPCLGHCHVYENDINYYDTPCIYRSPTIKFDPKRLEEGELPQILVFEIDDQSKEYIDVDRFREDVCSRWQYYPPLPLPIGARQAFIIPNIIKGFTHRDFFWDTYGSGTFNHVVDLQTEYVYISIYVSAGGASVVLENSVFGRIDI